MRSKDLEGIQNSWSETAAKADLGDLPVPTPLPPAHECVLPCGHYI